MSKHNKKEESIFDKMEKMTGIPVMYLAIILAVVVVIVIIGILYMVDMLPQDMLNMFSSNYTSVDSAPGDSVDSVDSALGDSDDSADLGVASHGNSGVATNNDITNKEQLTPLPPPPLPQTQVTSPWIGGGNIKIFKKR